MPEVIRCKAAFHWVDCTTGIDTEVRLYDSLFSVWDTDAAEGGFASVRNPDSLKTVTARVEPCLAAAETGFSCQYERLGYFVADKCWEAEAHHWAGRVTREYRMLMLEEGGGHGRRPP